MKTEITYNPQNSAGTTVGLPNAEVVGQSRHEQRYRLLRWFRTGGIAVLAAAATSACMPMYHPAQEVDSKPPKVSYNYTSDEGLVEANSKARTYCSQYAAAPSMRGTVTENDDGSKTVTFECVKTTTATPAPAVAPTPVPPRGYTYSTDAELLQAIRSANAYCAQSGQTASSNVVTNANGTKTLSYQCVSQ